MNHDVVNLPDMYHVPYDLAGQVQMHVGVADVDFRPFMHNIPLFPLPTPPSALSSQPLLSSIVHRPSRLVTREEVVAIRTSDTGGAKAAMSQPPTTVAATAASSSSVVREVPVGECKDDLLGDMAGVGVASRERMGEEVGVTGEAASASSPLAPSSRVHLTRAISPFERAKEVATSVAATLVRVKSRVEQRQYGTTWPHDMRLQFSSYQQISRSILSMLLVMLLSLFTSLMGMVKYFFELHEQYKAAKKLKDQPSPSNTPPKTRRRFQQRQRRYRRHCPLPLWEPLNVLWGPCTSGCCSMRSLYLVFGTTPS